ncbi:MAG: hypothetical protein ABJA57_06365 [Ginsengibacter sp.]
MKAATINTIKAELQQLPTNRLIEVCIRLARFKKDNKELLTFLLFESDDLEGYVVNVKLQADVLFEEINTSNIYFCKKSIRKIGRVINRYIQYSGSKIVEVELLLYFVTKIKESGIPIQKSTALNNLFNNQLKKIKVAVSLLHEDLQYDYLKQMPVE